MSSGAADAAATGDATVVWMAPAPPRVGEERAIAAWAEARRLRLSPPIDGAYPVLPSDPRIDGAAAAIDEGLARARDAITAGDGVGADAATAEAEGTVMRHPELPNAAWLLAEVLRTRATRLRRIEPVRPAEADDLWRRADALDGGRMAGVGEHAAPDPPPPAALVFDRGARAQIWLDGRAVAPGSGATPIVTSAGPHAIVVLRDDAPIWAGWIQVPPGTTLPSATVRRWALRAVPPCSREDFAAVELQSGSVAAPGVQCGVWVAATAAATTTPRTAAALDSVRIALCQGATCGPLQEVRHVADWASAPDWVTSRAASPADASPRWPAWATWTLVAGAAAASVIVVAISASVGSSGAADTRFVSGGLKPTP